MWRTRASRPGRWLGGALAVCFGFLLGNWQALKFAAADLTPSEKVALRFPETDIERPVTAGAATGAPMVLGDAELNLFSPEPMIADPLPQEPAPPQPRPEEITVSLGATEVAPADDPPATISVVAKREMKPPALHAARSARRTEADIAARRAGRPGFLLNDAQIASIKSRLHLTPDQERMWPAVEAALRNIAYAKTQVAQRRGGDRGADLAAIDPDSAAVQGLKSAAVPLIMSFSDEQKNEVRSLVHVMGLDKLAAEF